MEKWVWCSISCGRWCHAGVQQHVPQRRPAVRKKRGKSLAACVAELTAAARPSTPADQAAESGELERKHTSLLTV
jgi:hypothetical protein